MEQLQEKYEVIKSEIDEWIANFYDLCDKDDRLESLCLGWRVFFSPLIKEPDILFIGINPGAGWEGIDLEHKDKLNLEYLNYNYDLARETKSVFEEAGLSYLLNNSVKTNYYFSITRSQNEIYELAKIMGEASSNTMNNIFFEKSRSWTLRLIDIISPKLIICEGKEVFINIKRAFNLDAEMNGDIEEIVLPNGIKVIGYKRLYSIIKNKNILKEVLIKHFKN
jgi:hypothetical protein